MKHQSGFSLLESMLAITVVVIAGLGVYALFQSGRDSYHLTDASQEMIEIANVFTDLASADLTQNLSPSNIVGTFYASARLPSRYFLNSATQMVNAFSTLDFTDANAYSFSVRVPLGCLDTESTVPDQFCSAVKDLYSCGQPDFSTNQGCQTYVPLTFNLSG